MRRSGLILLLLGGCHAIPPDPQPRTPQRQGWVLVERNFDEVEYWILDAGDADVAAGATTLVFERIEVEERCRHSLWCTGQVPERPQVGDLVEITLYVACDPRDLHRIDLIPTRPEVQVVAITGALSELPRLSGFQVRGSARVTVKFTAGSRGPGGIKAILSEVSR